MKNYTFFHGYTICQIIMGTMYGARNILKSREIKGANENCFLPQPNFRQEIGFSIYIP